MMERNKHIEVKYICDGCGKTMPVPLPAEQADHFFPSFTRMYTCEPCRKANQDDYLKPAPWGTGHD